MLPQTKFMLSKSVHEKRITRFLNKLYLTPRVSHGAKLLVQLESPAFKLKFSFTIHDARFP